MATRQKSNPIASRQKSTSTQKTKAKDREENRKFIVIMAIATVLLMVLMYVIFVR